MDVYYAQMREEYAPCSHTYTKDMPKTCSKLMKACHFLSKHPKFEVKFLKDGSKQPPKHPNSIRKNYLLALEDNVDVRDSNSFVRHSMRSERPAGQQHSMQVDAINLIVIKVKQQTAGPATSTT